METGERNYAWYVMDGREGILSYIDNPKLAGIEPYEDDGSIGFYPFDTIPEGTEITVEDVCAEYSDSYDVEAFNKGEVIIYAQVKNAENKQYLIYAFVAKDYYEDDLYERMLCDDTNRYCNWTSDRTRFIDSQSEQETTKDESKAEWDEICDKYKGMNHYSEGPDFDEIWNCILEMREENEENS